MIRTSAHSAGGREKFARVPDSWGGRALVFLTAAAILSPLAQRLFDGAVVVRNATGGRSVATNGSTGYLVGLVLILAAILCAVIAIVNSNRRLVLSDPYVGWIAVLLLWWAISSILRGEDYSFRALLNQGGALIIAVGVIVAPPTRRTITSFSYLLTFTAISMLAYGLLHPEQQRPCRVDKCGIFDSLFTGYLYQENGAARFVVLLVPAAAAIRPLSAFCFTLVVSGVFVLATDSRTSLLAFFVGAIGAILTRRMLRRSDGLVAIPLVVRLVPIAFLLLSAWVFVNSNARDLTGRGAIYAGIRDQLKGLSLWLGSGSSTVENVVLRGGARASGEHGQASHILVEAGLPGLILFAGALLVLALRKNWNTYNALALTFAVVASVQFVTEPVWELQLNTMSFPLLLLTLGLFVRGVNQRPKEGATDSTREGEGMDKSIREEEPVRLTVTAPSR